MKKILIIGANSYIGKSLQNYIINYNDYRVTEDIDNFVAAAREDNINRNRMPGKNGRDNTLHVNMISASNGEWESEELSQYDTVLHLSGIVHRKEVKDMEDLYDKVNHRLPVAVAKKAKESNVKQFIFMSTAAIYGEKATRITKDTEPTPTTYYGKSKLAAEQDILKLQSKEFGVAIVRPPMVYGEGCKGNYSRLVRLARLMPIFPKLHNKRSMIHIDNLCEFLYGLIVKEDTGYYCPQDAEYVDTCELVVKLRREMGKQTLLIGIFNPLVRILTKHIGSINKMFGDCYYD